MSSRPSTANLIRNARRNKQVSVEVDPGIIFVRDDTCNVKETTTKRHESHFLTVRDYGSSTFAR